MTDPDCELSPERLIRFDYLRLKRQWHRLQRISPKRQDEDRSRWLSAWASAEERFQQRNAIALDLEIDSSLPIAAHRDAIIDAIQNRQVVVLCGETGSGKSTQLPKLCLAAGYGRYGWIGHTQPRRLAARSIAKRLAEEMGTTLGAGVGYKIRFQDSVQDNTVIKLMTDGVLLAEIHRDPNLDAYDAIILDEAHERSINIDLLMAYLKGVLERRPEMRVIITSATIDAERFSEHFGDALGPAPVILVEGRNYPVDVRYRGVGEAQASRVDRSLDGTDSVGETGGAMLTRFCHAVDELYAEGRGDILAFFPTERDIREAHKRLRGHLTRCGLAEQVEVLPLYARLTESEQQKIFQPHKKSRIVLATNVAESSLTVPGIRYVIDSGTSRVSRFAAKSRVQRLPIEPICQASANQRSGRCGRLGPGIAIRLYDESDYEARPSFSQPEIRRCDLASTMLQAKSLGIDELESLPWLDPPRPESVREAQQTLLEIGAIDERGALTPAGRQLARWPVSPRIGRMLLAAHEHGCLHEMLIIAAALECQDPRVRPPDQAQAADTAHQKFRDPNSDFLSYLRIWDFYNNLREQLGRSRLEKACRDHYLSLVRLREWGDVHRQLADQCREAKWHLGPRRWHGQDTDTEEVDRKLSDSYIGIHQSILSGQLSGVAMLDDQGKYRGASNMELQLWPGSSLRGSKAKWVVCAELVETNQRYGRTIARIDPQWIERVGQHALKYVYDSPHFSRNRGSAMVMRRGLLFGLPAVPRVAVPLAGLDPALSRTLLIEHGLAERQLVSRARFWSHNEAFLKELEEIGNRTRRRDCVVDPFVLLEFYRNCIPAEVVDRASLEKWDRTLPANANAPPYLSWEAIAAPVDRDEVRQGFPDQLAFGVTTLPVQYRFDPGSDADGVTVQVPVQVVEQLHQEKAEWLVPGLLEEKLTALLKSLPKRLRRQFVPIPDTVRQLLPVMRQSESQSEPFWKSLCQWCSQHLGETVRRDDFDLTSLPPHLRIRFEVKDEAGKIQHASRDLEELQRKALPKIRAESATSQPSPVRYPWHRDALQRWDIESLPTSVIESVGGVRMERYPTLQWSSGKIATGVVDHPHVAEQMLREQWIRLVANTERRELRSQIAYLPHWNASSLWVAHRWSQSLWTDWVTHIMARLALVEVDWSKGKESFSPAIRSLMEYEAIAVRRVERIGLAASELGRWVPKFAQAYHELRKVRESMPVALKSQLLVVDAQLAELLDDAHAFHTPWVFLKEFPRYLSAMTARLEKMKSFGANKDVELDRDAQHAWKDYFERIEQRSERISKPNRPLRWYPTGKLLEYRWMIEELRVSVHAQKLGTRVSVSPKRLEKLREQLDADRDGA